MKIILSSIHCIVVPPYTPTLVEATAAAPTSIVLTWTHPPMDMVDSFLIAYSFTIRDCDSDEAGMSPWWVVSGDTRNFSLTGLEENSDFVLSILARNSAGDSEVSQTTATTALASKLANKA